MIEPENKKDGYMVASQIAQNIMSEWEAIEQYYLLIQWLEKFNDIKGVETIEEIISDEKNHAMLLRELVRRYDNNIPTAED